MGVLEVFGRIGLRLSSSPDKYTIVDSEAELGHGTSGRVVIVRRRKDNKVSLHRDSY